MRLKARTRTRTGGKTYQPGEHFEVDDIAGAAMLKAGIADVPDPEPADASEGEIKANGKAKAKP